MSLVRMSSTLPRPCSTDRSRQRAVSQHQQTHTYTEFAQAVREHRLNERTRGFYLTLFTALILALGGTAVGILLLDDSWLQLLMAAHSA